MVQNTGYRDYPCDLCGSDEPIEIPRCRLDTGGQVIHICGNCGFVYARARRSVAGKRVCDADAGAGYFLRYLKDRYGVGAFGIEPSTRNCARLRDLGIDSFDGTIVQPVKDQPLEVLGFFERWHSDSIHYARLWGA
jgi:hypothetical protein